MSNEVHDASDAVQRVLTGFVGAAREALGPELSESSRAAHSHDADRAAFALIGLVDELRKAARAIEEVLP